MREQSEVVNGNEDCQETRATNNGKQKELKQTRSLPVLIPQLRYSANYQLPEINKRQPQAIPVLLPSHSIN